MSPILVLITVLATAFAVYSILKLYGVFEFAGGVRSASRRIDERRSEEKTVASEQRRLRRYSKLTNMFRGILLPQHNIDDLQYYIARLEIRSEPLNRLYTVEEYRGKYAMIGVYIGIFTGAICLAVALGGGSSVVIRVLLAVGVVLILLANSLYKVKAMRDIYDEDDVIDKNFINLYLLLYSKLRQGSRARIVDTVQQYVDTMKENAGTREDDVMLKLGKQLLNLLNQYQDEVAVEKLKDTYRSATIVNFCAAAGTALRGVDNGDNLLTLRQQLERKQENAMREKSHKILQRGSRAIYGIYVILGVLVIVSMISKLPLGMFSAVFGGQ